jgi:predicted acetyltransferase
VSSDLFVRPPEGDAELNALAAIESWAFGVASPADTSSWLATAGHENIRVGFRGSKIAGGLLHVPMGQWFGGASVPMVGIAGVAIAPEERGRGAARALMRATLRELRQRNVPLSTLYPATLPLYRAVGYECAGSRFSIRVRPSEIGISERDLPIRPLDESDAERVAALYQSIVKNLDGHLDRGQYIWRRVRAPRNETARGFGIEVDGELEGYIYVRQKSLPGSLHYELVLTDAMAATPRAARRVLGFLADHRSLADAASWYGGPFDPLLSLLPERGYSMTLADHWMIRIVDVEAALRLRGYPPGLSRELELEIHDELLEENNGRVVLEIGARGAELRRGGDGRLRLDIRGLAPLYSGFASPYALARTGLLSGDDVSLASAAAIFAGPAPAMIDMF